VWQQTAVAWKTIAPCIVILPPCNFEEWLNSHFWWNSAFPAIGPAFSRFRAATLYRAGLQRVRDAWIGPHRCFLSVDEAASRFGLRSGEFRSWSELTHQLAGQGGRLLHMSLHNPQSAEWFGIYDSPQAAVPNAVIQRRHIPGIPILPQRLLVAWTEEFFTVRTQSCTLHPIRAVDHGAAVMHIRGYPAQVRVIHTSRGQRKLEVFFFYGRLSDLRFDPGRLTWSDQSPFLDYSTQKGRALLKARHTPPDLAKTKWPMVLSEDFHLNWAEVWTTGRARKEAHLVWQMWHRAVATNVWRGVISPNIDITCPMCELNEPENILHRFWFCPMSQLVWEHTSALLSLLTEEPDVGQDIDWQQALFAAAPSKFSQRVTRLWVLLRGLTLWAIWITRNQVVFSRVQWHLNQVRQMIWKGLGEYARATWHKCRLSISQDPESTSKALAKFDAHWGHFPALCHRNNLHISWHRQCPDTGIG
jgi:hypothetical protein